MILLGTKRSLDAERRCYLLAEACIYVKDTFVIVNMTCGISKWLTIGVACGLKTRIVGQLGFYPIV